MTIEKGREWGHRGLCPQHVQILTSDCDVATMWATSPHTVFVVQGGDAHTALGRPTWSAPTEVQYLPFDMLQVTISLRVNDTEQKREMYALSSVEIGSWLSRKRYVCVSNCGFIGSYNIAPRAHPNDGEMDVVTIGADMDWRQRLQARSRARLGQHVPHPHISMERGTSSEWTRQSAREQLAIDGVEIRHWSAVRVDVIADACTVVV
jgi:hypothetical protein